MDLASARRVRISDEATVMHTIPHTPDAEQQPRRDDVREQFVNYAEGLADVYVELKRLERSTGVAKAAEIIEQAANAALKKLQARFSSKSGSVDANDSPTNAILEKAARRAVQTVQCHEELLDEQSDEVELMRQRLSELKADVVRLKEQLAFARSARPAAAPSLPAPLPRPVDTAPRPPTVISLNTYSWEDKQSTVLVWVEVAEEAALREDSFNAQLLPESIKATVVGASGTSYRFAQRLYQPIDVAACKVRCQGKRMVFSLAKREPKSWLQLKEMKVVSLSKDGRLPTNEELRGTGIKRIA